MSRPTDYKPEYCQAVIEHMKDGASLTSFAAEINVARSTINYWMESFPEFSEAVKIAKAKCAAWWEKVSRTNAIEGGGNATLCIFGLKNMAPDEWREKQEIQHSGSIDISKMSDEELERKIAELASAGGQ
jgi:transposase